MKLINLTNKNLDPSSVNKNRYIFEIKNSQLLKGSVALASMVMPYSTPNIQANNYKNNTFQIIYNGQINNFIIQDGFYTLENLNSYLQYLMREGTNNIPYNIVDNLAQYFIELKYDIISYSVRLNIYPTILNGTPGKIGAIYNGLCPQINFNSNLNLILGLQQNILYPSISNLNTNYTITSNDLQLKPNLTPSNVYILLSNIVDNNLSIPSNILYNFSPQVTYGSNINVNPNSLIFCKISDGYYNKIIIDIVDENYNPLLIKDENLLISLVLDIE